MSPIRPQENRIGRTRRTSSRIRLTRRSHRGVLRLVHVRRGRTVGLVERRRGFRSSRSSPCRDDRCLFCWGCDRVNQRIDLGSLPIGAACKPDTREIHNRKSGKLRLCGESFRPNRANCVVNALFVSTDWTKVVMNDVGCMECIRDMDVPTVETAEQTLDRA